MSENGNGNGELTGLQRAFVDAWFALRFNGVEAARAAGYQGDENALAVAASRTLRIAKVRTEIARRWAAHGMTAEEVMAGWGRIARSNIADLYDETGNLQWDKVQEHGDLIESLEWARGSRLKVKLYSRQAALDSIARSLGMFKDKVGLDVTSGGSAITIREVIVELPRQDEPATVADRE